MIGSLLPSVFPNGSFGIQDSSGGDDSSAVRTNVSAPLAQLRGVDSEESERGIRQGRHGLGDEGHDFVHTAKHMIRDALKTFSHDLRDSFHELGFKSDMVMRLAHDVMQAAKQALKSGADFTANLMMAAISQTTTTSAAGASSSSFEMVASEIEITINHATGSVEVSATKVEIKNEPGGGSSAPQLVDFVDTEGDDPGAAAVPVLAMNDLDSILAGDESGGETEALGPVLTGLPDDPAEAAGETDGTEPADETDVGAAEESDTGTAPAGEDGEVFPAPQLSGVSHVIITAFERYLNADQQQITYVKFDAVIPLGAPSQEESVAEAVAKSIAEAVTEQATDPTEVPIVEQVIEEPVGQPATTDLVA